MSEGEQVRQDAPQAPGCPAALDRRPAGPLANPNFRLLWLGESVSLLGDQFYAVALLWLVLELTSSALALGTVLFVGGVARAALMLVGGAVADRLSPRWVMLASNAGRAVLVGLLGALVAAGGVQLWMLYLFALAFGVVDAFFLPASLAMLPTLLDRTSLRPANALMQGAVRITQSVGPSLAGVVVKAAGLALAFAVDALSFLVAALALALLRLPPSSAPARRPGAAARPGSLTAAIAGMLGAVWADRALRGVMLVAAAVSLLWTGPVVVGPAMLARERFPAEGPLALGAILSAFGVGSLVGMLAAGTLRPARFGVTILGLMAGAGVALAALGLAADLTAACLALGLAAAGAGFAQVLIVTWLQQQAAGEMLGRVMGLFMLVSVGLAPLSVALAGALADLSLTAMLASLGLLLALVCVAALAEPELRDLEASEGQKL